MLVVQINIFMVILLSSLAVHAWFRLDRKEPTQKTFFTLLLMTLVILVLEILSVLLNSSTYSSLITVHRLVDTLGFLLTPVVPICAIVYVAKRTSKYIKLCSRKYLWLGLPLVLNSIAALGSFNLNWIFSITGENIYVRGPLFFISPMTSYFYYVVNFVILYRIRDKLSREELTILSLLTLIPALLSIVQLYYFIYLTIWNSVAIAVVINYIFIVHSQMKIDPLTRLGNRTAYNEYLAMLERKNNLALAVVNIDLDGFKKINDVYGHHEGDKVLQLFARQLEAVFDGKGVCIRWGGDEFIVLLNENRAECLQRYIETLQRNINDYNRSNNKAYQIKFSYGMSVFNNTYSTIHELIEHSDKLMYEAKNKKQLLVHGAER